MSTKEYYREWYQRNREKVSKKKREYYIENKEKIRQKRATSGLPKILEGYKVLG